MMKLVVHYFSASVMVTILVLLIYVCAQQEYRSKANNPQIALATEIKNDLEKSISLSNIFPQDTMDLSVGDGVFAIVFDNQCRPIRSSAFLDGEAPCFPPGIFEIARTKGEDRVTWCPRRNIRMALVVLKVNVGGTEYVASGRSLAEVEKREFSLLKSIIVAWILCMAVIAANAVVNFLTKKPDLPLRSGPRS